MIINIPLWHTEIIRATIPHCSDVFQEMCVITVDFVPSHLVVTKSTVVGFRFPIQHTRAISMVASFRFESSEGNAGWGVSW